MFTIGLGPFIGDFEQELYTFRPYISWISEISTYKNFYLSTHFNRLFLYDWIDKDNILPVFEHLTRDELLQRGVVHGRLTVKEFSLLVRQFKEDIMEASGHNRKEVSIYFIPYSKTPQPLPLHNKYVRPCSPPKIKIKTKPKVILIPDIKEDVTRLDYIYTVLLRNYDVKVVGDFKIHFVDDNIVLGYVDYFENCYKYICKYIFEADIVVCPAGHWTLLCNMLGKPVFSWGSCVSQFKENGLYYLNNHKSLVIPCDETMPPERLIELFQNFYQSTQNKHQLQKQWR